MGEDSSSPSCYSTLSVKCKMADDPKFSIYTPDGDYLISLKFGREFDHVTADTLQVPKDKRSRGKCPPIAKIYIPYRKSGSPNSRAVRQNFERKLEIAIAAHARQNADQCSQITETAVEDC